VTASCKNPEKPRVTYRGIAEQIGQALWLEVAARLRERILAGELAPGERLAEVEIASEFQISRGPVKDAIRQLASEGLVVEVPRRGAFVATLQHRDLIEVYAVRKALDLAATPAVIVAASDSDLEELSSILDAFESSSGGYLDRAVHDMAFHRALIALSGNVRMTTIYEHMLLQTMLLLRHAAETRAQLRTQMPHAIHRDIVAALRTRNEVLAVAALSRHYEHARNRLEA